MKKMRGLRKFICVGLVLSMVLGLCACGKKEEGTAVDNSALAKQYVYSYQDIEFPNMGNEVTVNSVIQQDDRVYMVIENYNWYSVDEEYSTNMISMKTDGTDIRTVEIEFPQTESSLSEEPEEVPVEDATEPEEVPVEDVASEDVETEEPADAEDIPAEEDVFFDDMEIEEYDGSMTYEYSGYTNYVLTSNGNLLAVREYCFEDATDPENYIYKEEYYLSAWDLEGKFLWEKPIELQQTEDEYLYITKLVPYEDGTVSLLISGNNYYKMTIDAEGNFSEKEQLKNVGEILMQSNDLIQMDDGSLLVTYYDESWTSMYMASCDLKSDTVDEAVKLPDSIAWSGYNSIMQGAATDIVYSTSDGLYGYSAGDEQSVQLMSFVNSDLSTSYMNKAVMLDDEHFIGFYTDNIEGTSKAAYFTKRNPEDIPDKEVIVVGGVYVDYELINRIVEFNQQSDQYRVVVKEYDSYNTMDDYSAGYSQLNNDIISGNMPDILVDDSSLPIDSYIAKGLIADVGELIENDEELSQVEYLDNVFNAFKVDEKLYYVMPSFSVRTMIGKESFVGDKQGWSMPEFLKFAESLPEETVAVNDMTRDYFLYLVLQYCGNDLIDVSTGKCNFDSEEFIDMLEYAATLMAEYPDDYYGEDYWMNYQSQFREDRTVLMDTYASSMQDLCYYVNGFFGEDISYVGFPTESGEGSIIVKDTAYVLSAKSENLEGAWEFMRYYLTDEYQSSLEWGFPVSKKAFMEKAQEALNKPYYYDENGEKVEYDQYIEINGESVALEQFNQEQIDQAVNMILAIEKGDYYSESIENIILEEAAAFFEGQKTAKEVAEIIQSRAQIYVDENR